MRHLCSFWTTLMAVVPAVVLVIPPGQRGQHAPTADENVAPLHQIEWWVDAVLRLVRNVSCADSAWTSPQECEQLKEVPKEQMNVYAVGPIPEGRLVAVLPDGPMSGRHDVVVAVDPFPAANFGHLVVVAFVDFGRSPAECAAHGGIELGEGECLSLGWNERCLEGRKRRCDVDFLPLVHLASERAHQNKQRLRCVRNLTGFARCPQLRSVDATATVACDPLRSNTQRCARGKMRGPGTRCKLFQTCDRAVILSGGWNRESSPSRHEENVRAVHGMLRKNGFHESNIRTFFANGESGHPAAQGEGNRTVFLASSKLAFRYHVQKLCRTAHCVDTLVIYMNSPSRRDGSSLLWDADGNGQVDDGEAYSVRELLHDVRECAANQVYVLVEQNFAGAIVRAASRSQHHKNVQIFASSGESEYAWGSEFTKHWVATEHLYRCMTQVQQSMAVRRSRPTFYDGSEGSIRKTLSGAPCDARPRFTRKELEARYLGCQNLPTSVWMEEQ